MISSVKVMCACDPVFLYKSLREVTSELTKLTEVLEKLQHRPRDADGKNLYDEVCVCMADLLEVLKVRMCTCRSFYVARNYFVEVLFAICSLLA